MTLALNLLASSGAEVEVSRALMILWLIIALSLSVIEVWLGLRHRENLSALYVRERRSD